MLHLIHNPVAGRGRSHGAATVVQARLAERGIESRIWMTHHPRHATEIVRELPVDANVVAVGGDGTVHEVAKSCIGTARTLGVVPVGSGDDYAHAIGVPRGRLDRAVEVLVAGRTRTIDTGTCNGEPFVNAVGVGFDAEVGRRLADAPRYLRGITAYLWSVAVSLRDLTLVVASIEADGRPVYHGPCLLASCQNGPRTGGSFRFAPMAAVDDGALDLLVAGDVRRLGTLGLLPRVLVGRHLSHPQVRHVRARSISMRWEAPRDWHTEGETFAPVSTFEIAVRPASLRVVTP